MSEVRVLVGLPYSGKSTYAENFKDYQIISLDEIRKEFGDASDQSHNPLVVSTARDRLISAIRMGADVIYDATNLKRKYRTSLINDVRDVCPRTRFIAVVFPQLTETELETRMGARERYVSKEVIERMNRSFTLPTIDEGYNQIIYLGKE